MRLAIPKTATVVAVKDQVFCTLDQEAVILQLKNGVYYGLNAVGTTVWNALQQPRTVAELNRLLQDEYEVEGERCENDLRQLLEKLAEAGLVEITQ